MVDDIIASVKEDIVSPTVPPASSVQTGNPPVTNSKTALQEFRNLVGTDTPSDLSYNIGIYQRALQQQRRCRILCLLTSYLSTILLWLQIVLAAAITGLSAYKETSPVALTTLGAFNTVVAGLLAWQKGQGIPQRYRKAQDQYTALILEIEMAERSFMPVKNDAGIDNSKLEPRAEVDRLWKLFNTARADQQANYPDLYVSTGARDSKILAEQLADAKADAAKMQAELLAKVDALVVRLESKLATRVGGVIDSVFENRERGS